MLSVPVLLRLPLNRLLPLLDVKTLKASASDARTLKIIQLTSTILSKLRPLFHSYCLTRSLTLFYFLRREGLELDLCFGMGQPEQQNDSFAGHCWLVRNGEPYLEKTDPRPLFTEMFCYSGVKG
jgi:Transglutaminase-like superfamily